MEVSDTPRHIVRCICMRIYMHVYTHKSRPNNMNVYTWVSRHVSPWKGGAYLCSGV